MLSNEYANVINVMNTAIQNEPNNWFPIYMRGASYLLSGQYPLAVVDLDKSLTLSPQANLPYLVDIVIKMRTGQYDAVGKLYLTVRRDYPDPTFGERLIDVLTAKNTPNEFREQFNLISALFLGRYRDLLNLSDEIIKTKTVKTDLLLSALYFARGYSFCNLDNDKDAEDAYTQGLRLDAENVSLYMLRADGRKRLGNLIGAGQDVAMASSRSTDPNFSAYTQANITGQLTCKNAFEFMSARAAATPDTASTVSATAPR